MQESRARRLKELESILQQVLCAWFERVKGYYVTEEESRQLGVEPEVKFFHDSGRYRIKFSRTQDLDVTYGLQALDDGLNFVVESSVNNKSEGFDFDLFVGRLKDYYWRSRNEKPWTHPRFDHFTYGDLMPFEPHLGKSVTLDAKKEKADIIRLRFPLSSRHEDLIMDHPELLRDLIENYCLHPLKRIYAESYREN